MVAEHDTSGVATRDGRMAEPEKGRGVAFLALLTLSAAIGTLGVLLPAAVILLPLPSTTARAAYRRVTRLVAAGWFTFASALIEKVARVQIITSGSGCGPAPSSERVAVMICNHHCRVDWLYLWTIACRLRCAGKLKIALREDMKKAPLFGWAMQAFQFIFLARSNRELDLARIDGTLTYLAQTTNSPILLLIFPEGSDLSPINQQREVDFAAKLGEPPLRHLLRPRSAGLAQVLRSLGPKLDAVYDATLWYDRHPLEVAAGARPSEKSLLAGTFPRAVHAHIERVPASELPAADDEPAVAAWLKARWLAKEARLHALLVDGAPPLAGLSPRAGLAVEYALALSAGGAACVALVVGLVRAWPLLAYALVGSAAFALATASLGGIDTLERRLKGARPSGGARGR